MTSAQVITVNSRRSRRKKPKIIHAPVLVGTFAAGEHTLELHPVQLLTLTAPLLGTAAFGEHTVELHPVQLLHAPLLTGSVDFGEHELEISSDLQLELTALVGTASFGEHSLETFELANLPQLHTTARGLSSGSTHTCPVEISTTAPDTLIYLEIWTAGDSEEVSVTGITDDLGLTWAQRQEHTRVDGTTTYKVETWYAVQADADTNNIVVTFGNANDLESAVSAAVYYGADLTTIFDPNVSVPKAADGSSSDTIQATGVSTTYNQSAIIANVSGFSGPASVGSGFDLVDGWQSNFVWGHTAEKKNVASAQSSITVDFGGTLTNWIVTVDAILGGDAFPMQVLWADNLRLYTADSDLTSAGYIITGTNHATVVTGADRLGGTGSVVRATDDDADDGAKGIGTVAAGNWAHFLGWFKMGTTIPQGPILKFQRASNGRNAPVAIVGGAARKTAGQAWRAGIPLATEVASPGYLQSKGNTWVHLEAAFLNGDVSGRFKIWLDQTLIIDFTGDTTTASFSAEDLDQIVILGGDRTFAAQVDWNDIVAGTGTGGNQIGYHYVDDSGVPHLGATP